VVEADFAREFEVSNGTIRSALRHLQGEGLVELRPRRGMFVSAMDPSDALELCTLRDALEALAARLAAKNAAMVERDALRKLMLQMQSAVKKRDATACMALDLSFHKLIVDMSKHKRLIQMYGLLEAQIRLFMALTESMHADLFADMIPIHQPIVDAILAGDAQTAWRLSGKHNLVDGEALARSLRQNDQLKSA
jgi:DNA-binding GntR family transcriptional regulator